ncbi:MAG: flagellar motor protein MotB [Rubrimonas sp.]|uniref:flagellar motor protein MotB n=1 Tax=Rubrimonas sp. TaxID=2036015 RepID=UPI002FDEB278
MAEDPSNKKRPLIIKRKKVVGGGGHHGGAWKVAYADFVTAMMAFFLLMWLLNATTEDQKKGLADYFDSRVPIARMSGGGRDIFHGDSMTATRKLAESGGGVKANSDGTASGEGALEDDPKGSVAEVDPTARAAAAAEAEAEARAFREVEKVLQSLGGESAAADAMLAHVRTRQTPDGLVIDIFDRSGAPLFERGSSRPTPMLIALVDVVASVAGLATNPVAVAGHTDATPFDVGGDDGNWRLSSDRADAARRLLIGSGLDPGRIAEVSGRAATEPMVEDPLDPANRRIAITLLRRAGR